MSGEINKTEVKVEDGEEGQTYPTNTWQFPVGYKCLLVGEFTKIFLVLMVYSNGDVRGSRRAEAGKLRF